MKEAMFIFVHLMLGFILIEVYSIVHQMLNIALILKIPAQTIWLENLSGKSWETIGIVLAVINFVAAGGWVYRLLTNR